MIHTQEPGGGAAEGKPVAVKIVTKQVVNRKG